MERDEDIEITVADVELAIKIISKYLQNVQKVQRLMRAYNVVSQASYHGSFSPQQIMDYIMQQTMTQTLAMRKQQAGMQKEEEEQIITKEELEKFRSIASKVSQEAKK